MITLVIPLKDYMVSLKVIMYRKIIKSLEGNSFELILKEIIKVVYYKCQ